MATLRKRVESLWAEIAELEAAPEPPHECESLPLFAWSQRFLAPKLSDEPAPFHFWLCDELDRISIGGERGQRINTLAPRGSAKSTFVSLAFALREALHNREPFIALCSDTLEQAADFLATIKEELENNELIQEVYPKVAGIGPVWQARRITLRNGVEIRAFSPDTKIRGRKTKKNIRPSLILLDDLQNKDHITSPKKREKTMTWLTKDALSAGDARTNFVSVGTALHREAVVCQLDERRGLWRSRVWKSLGTLPDGTQVDPLPVRMDLWAEWENHLFDHADPEAPLKARAYYEANQIEMDRGHGPDGQVVLFWPARQPLYNLMVKRAMDGVAAFNSEQMNDPIDPSACEWPSEYFTHGDRP